MVLASIQRSEFLTDRTRRQYRALARRCGFVGIVGHDIRRLADHSMEGVRTADFDPDDVMTTAWHVVLLSPTVSIALLATEADGDDAGRDADRRFRYRLVTNAGEVESAARRLLTYF